jgi:ribulose-5-phosphate 4-epimerase/fuculose-1-phosphate aldolase
MPKTQVKTAPSQVSPEEWKVRVDLAACYRLVAHYGWDDLIFTHISARVPGPETHFLINPYGMMFDEITASSLVKIDLRGNKVADSPTTSTRRASRSTSAVHEARTTRIACCICIRPRVSPCPRRRDGLLPISQQSLFPLSALSYHAYEGVALNPDEKPRLVADLGANELHDPAQPRLLTCGETVARGVSQHVHPAALVRSAGDGTGRRQGTDPIPQPILDGIRQMSTTVTRGAGASLRGRGCCGSWTG